MLVFRCGRADLAAVRFAVSPLMEIFNSVRAFESSAAQAQSLGWCATGRTRLAQADLRLLAALRPMGAYAPDFVHPPPEHPVGRLDDELERVLHTSPTRVRTEIRQSYAPAAPPAVLQPFIDTPRAALSRLAEVARRYWDAVLGPDWPRISALLEGDVLYRARQLADVGLRGLFADLHPDVAFADGNLTISKRVRADCALGGRGVLLLPSAFVAPSIGALYEKPWQPTLVYPARGAEVLWAPPDLVASSALGDLLGQRRAQILLTLESSSTTTQLTRQLGVPASSVSQHLSVLRRAGLVRGHRVKRTVLYTRTKAGRDLVLQCRGE